MIKNDDQRRAALWAKIIREREEKLIREAREREEALVQRKIIRISNWSIVIVTTLFLTFVLGGIAVTKELTKDLPPIVFEREEQPLITRVYDINGQLIGEFFSKKRMVVPLTQIPKDLINAFLAIEDTDFYRHNGVSFRGIVRAIITNLKEGRRAQGGSTITQQLARMLRLSTDKVYIRKIKEILLALQIERVYSKDEILQFYLNHVYLGSNAYGVQAAARTYYGKDVWELSLAECAMIAGLPQLPSVYSPFINPELARWRRSLVLKRMVDLGFITKKDAREANEAPLFDERMREAGMKNRAPYFMEYVRQWIEERYGYDGLYMDGLQVYTTLDLRMQEAAQESMREWLRNTDALIGYYFSQDKERRSQGREYAQEKIRTLAPFRDQTLKSIEEGKVYRGIIAEMLKGRVVVNMDGVEAEIDMEHFNWNPDEAFINSPRELHEGKEMKFRVVSFDEESGKVKVLPEPRLQGGLISIDPRNGYIKAMVGGYDFYDEENNGKYNRAVQARRQPGSAFKPFIYTAALNNGYTPATIINDSPIIFRKNEIGEEARDVTEGEAERADKGRFNYWVPRNYENKYFGPTTVRVAIEKSRNVPAVKVLNDLVGKIGFRGVIWYPSQMMGIDPKRISRDLSMILGTTDVTPLELASGYAVLANHGVRAEPRAILYVKDRYGNVIYQSSAEEKILVDERVAYIVTNMLRGVISRGTASYTFNKYPEGAELLKEKDLAGKTGTTDSGAHISKERREELERLRQEHSEITTNISEEDIVRGKAVDEWAVIFTPDLVTAAYVGDDDRLPLSHHTGYRSIWGLESTVPLVLFYLHRIKSLITDERFGEPLGIVKRNIDLKSGKLATPQNKSTFVESFIAGTEPREVAPPDEE
ncbi:MAG: penicillin-binding protein 1A [bacterium]